MMLKYRMQADYYYVISRKLLEDALRLGNAVLHTSRTKHLESVQHDNPTAKACKRQRLFAVEPLCYLKLRR